MVLELSVDIGEQQLLRIVGSGVEGSLRLLLGRQALDEAHASGDALQAPFLNVFGDDRPGPPADLHRLVADEQDVQIHFNFREGGSVLLKVQRREEQAGLLVVDFVGEPLAILECHAIEAPYGVDEIST